MKVKINDCHIRYHISGEPGRPVIMLSHSLSTSMAMWDVQMQTLESRYQVLRYDTRGHGESDAPSGAYTLEQLATDAVGLLDHLEIDAVTFVGLSMGGMIGQCLALEHPERLRCLVLSSTTALIPEEAQPIWQERIDTALENGMEALADDTLDRWFTPDFIRQQHPAVDTIRELIVSTPVSGFVGCGEAIRRLNLLQRLTSVSVPTLILVGEGDPGTPVAASQAIHAKITDSQLVIVPDAYHLCNIEQRQVFNDSLTKFLLAND